MFCFQFLLGFSAVFEALPCLSALPWRQFNDSILFCSCENVEAWEKEKPLSPVTNVFDKYLLSCTKAGLI